MINDNNDIFISVNGNNNYLLFNIEVNKKFNIIYPDGISPCPFRQIIKMYHKILCYQQKYEYRLNPIFKFKPHQAVAIFAKWCELMRAFNNDAQKCLGIFEEVFKKVKENKALMGYPCTWKKRADFKTNLLDIINNRFYDALNGRYFNKPDNLKDIDRIIEEQELESL